MKNGIISGKSTTFILKINKKGTVITSYLQFGGSLKERTV